MAYSPTRFARARALFDELVGRAGRERDVRLAEARLGDPRLAADVAALLDAHGAGHDFLESPIVTCALTWGDSASDGTANGVDAVAVGQILGHYRLEQCVGAGGMGVVYRASDIALGRAAAVKLLPGATSPELQDRLKAEAIACGRLQHPAIATFFESGEVNGRAFIAMEYVAGDTLRTRLEAGPLGVDRAVAIAASLLEALSHAHAAGVLHRDIKPENVMITGDHTAKLLDFGIAALLVATDADAMTMAGPVVAGTVGYMSPEQITNRSLDARSDVFQVAAVLYEMLAGAPAFPGRTASERLAAVLTLTPPPLDAHGVDDALARVLFRALAKEPAQRPASAGAFLAALQDAREGVTLELPKSLAVLPFLNAGAPEDDWIGTGIADTVSATLARHPSVVLVRPERTAGALRRASAASAEARAIEVGASLGCRWVVAGAFRRLGPALRLSPMLLEVSTGSIVLREDIDGTLDGIFALHDRVCELVLARVAAAELERGARAQPAITAYEHYARGIRLARSGDRSASSRARELLEAAVAIEPAYPEALVGLAQAHALSYTFTNDVTALHTSLDYSSRAIDADPDASQAHVWRGYSLMRLGQEDEAQAAFARARALDPNDIFAYYFAGGPGWTRRLAASIALTRDGVTRSPTFGPAWWSLGSLYTAVAHYDEAASCFERCARLKGLPDVAQVAGVEAYWAECLRRAGRLSEARTKCLEGLDAVEQSDFLFRDSIRVFALVTLGRIANDQGDTAAARVAFQQAIEHVQGRPGTMAGGTLWVRAQACLARLDGAADRHRQAAERFDNRQGFDFSWFNLCDDYETCAILAESALAVGHTGDAELFGRRASSEAPPAYSGSR